MGGETGKAIKERGRQTKRKTDTGRRDLADKMQEGKRKLISLN